MRPAAVVLGLLALAALWLWYGTAREDELAADFDVSLLDVRTALLVAGPPERHPCLQAVTSAAIGGLAARLAEDGFHPAMRRGARPQPKIEVVARVPFGEREPPSRLAPDLADSSIYLALERFELLGWEAPEGDRPGHVTYVAEGRVWVFLPADGGARAFHGDFGGRRESSFPARELVGAPAEPELAAAFHFGRRLLETWQRGLVWRSPSAGRQEGR